MNFNFANPGATIVHLNTRKGGPEDDKILGVDMKLTGEVDNSGYWLQELLNPISTDHPFLISEDINLFFWEQDRGEANSRFLGISEIKLSRGFPAPWSRWPTSPTTAT